MGELKDAIDAKFAEAGASISNIAADVKLLTERGEGGLTKAEAEDIFTKLSSVAHSLKALDETTPPAE